MYPPTLLPRLTQVSDEKSEHFSARQGFSNIDKVYSALTGPTRPGSREVPWLRGPVAGPGRARPAGPRRCRNGRRAGSTDRCRHGDARGCTSGRSAGNAPGLLERTEARGKSGRHSRVLNCDSEYGLSSETCGRLWVRATFRSISSFATVLERMLVLRSACRVRIPEAMCQAIRVGASRLRRHLGGCGTSIDWGRFGVSALSHIAELLTSQCFNGALQSAPTSGSNMVNRRLSSPGAG